MQFREDWCTYRVTLGDSSNQGIDIFATKVSRNQKIATKPTLSYPDDRNMFFFRDLSCPRGHKIGKRTYRP